jgi:hypothetical protein
MSAFKAALVLNNYAIALMERSCFDLAFDTLKDAVLLVKASQQENRGLPEEMVFQKLDEATRRIASTSSTSAPSLDVVSHNDADFSKDGTIEDGELLIRFDTTDSDLLEQPEDSLDICASVILYNFGMAALLRNRQDSGIKYLAFALQILQGIFDRSQDDAFVLKRIVFISTIVLTTLIPAQLSRGLREEAEVSADTLNYFAEVAVSLQGCGLFTQGFELCASAA